MTRPTPPAGSSRLRIRPLRARARGVLVTGRGEAGEDEGDRGGEQQRQAGRDQRVRVHRPARDGRGHRGSDDAAQADETAGAGSQVAQQADHRSGTDPGNKPDAGADDLRCWQCGGDDRGRSSGHAGHDESAAVAAGLGAEVAAAQRSDRRKGHGRRYGGGQPVSSVAAAELLNQGREHRQAEDRGDGRERAAVVTQRDRQVRADRRSSTDDRAATRGG